VPTRSISVPTPRPGGLSAVAWRVVLGPRAQRPDATPTVTTSSALRRRLPVDAVARGEPGMALVMDERNQMGWVRLTPWFAHEPWRSAALEPRPGRAPTVDPGHDRHPVRHLEPPVRPEAKERARGSTQGRETGGGGPLSGDR